jgi:hypothetical protein
MSRRQPPIASHDTCGLIACIASSEIRWLSSALKNGVVGVAL